MIMLVVTFCTVAGNACVDREWPVGSALPTACVVQAQREAGAYLQEHPKYRLARFSCVRRDLLQVPT